MMRRAHWLAIAVLMAGFALRIYDLGADALWYDEVLQVEVGQAPTFRSFLGQLRQYPMAVPLDWFSTRLVQRLDDSEFFLRIPPMFWGTLAVALTYRLGRQTMRPPAALIGALLVALWSFHVRYSQEVRPYAALGTFYLASVSALFSAVRRPRRKRRWLAAGVILWIGSYFHAYVLFAFVMGLAACGGARLGPNERRLAVSRLLAVALAVGVLFLPAYYFFGSGSFGVDLYEHGRSFSRVVGIGLGWLRFNFDGEGTVAGVWEVMLLTGLLAALGQVAANPAHNKWLWALALGTAAQIALIYAGDVWRSYWFLSRQLIHLAPAIMLLAGSGLAVIASAAAQGLARALRLSASTAARSAARLATGLAVLIVLSSLPGLANYYTYPRTTAREIAALLVAEHQPGTPVFIIYGYELRVYRYYLQRLPGGDGVIPDLHGLEFADLPSLAQAPTPTFLAVNPRATPQQLTQIAALGFAPLYQWSSPWMGAQSLFVRKIGYN